MYSEIDETTDDWTWQVAETDVLALAGETAALGDAVVEAFRLAASAFYGSPEFAGGLGGDSLADTAILAKIVALLRQRTLAGEHYRRIGELQQIAGAFAQMGRVCHEIEGVALELQRVAETLIARAAPDVYELLRMLIQQTYVVVRGSVLAVRNAQPQTARHVLEATAELDRILLDLRNAAQRAIALYEHSTFHFQQVVVAGARMREIGVQAQAVARLVAQAPSDAPTITAYD